MLLLETKQSGGKLLPHSNLRGGGGGVFLGETPRGRIYSEEYRLLLYVIYCDISRHNQCLDAFDCVFMG
jgi:hypothetical protein